MDEHIIVGIDVGTTKTCTLVAREESPGVLCILGVGIEPSRGIRKGVVVDLDAVSRTIERSVDKAERTSGIEITSALVSIAGSNVKSINKSGAVAVSGEEVDLNDISRAVDSARAIPIPPSNEVVHVIQRGYKLDGQEGIRDPVRMLANLLEVETHIVYASTASIENLRKCVNDANVDVTQFVLNPLAAGEEALNETEREMGVVICDIGGGTTGLAIYVDENVWYSSVLGIGGNHITSDIAQGLRVSLEEAEAIKLQYGHALEREVDIDQYFPVRTLGDHRSQQVSHRELVHIINARVEEIFSLVFQEIKRSGYDGLFPAGMVLCGGCCSLPGIDTLAEQVMGLSVRIAKPENIVGRVDNLSTPAFTTSVGLLRWALLMKEFATDNHRQRHKPTPNGNFIDWELVKKWLIKLLP